MQGICSCLPDVTPAAHRALYETVVDFYEAEREAGDGGDDDLVRETHELRASASAGGAVEPSRLCGRFPGVSRSAITSSTRGSSLRGAGRGVSTWGRCGTVCSCCCACRAW